MKKPKSALKLIDAQLTLTIGGVACEFKLSVPENKTTPAAILPFVRTVTNKAISIAVDEFTKDGKQISCKKGCGACCAQLVPISEIETREIAKLIKSYPKPKKKALMDKFNAAKKQFVDEGIWELLTNPEKISEDQIRPLGHAYFSQQIPCPFLEDGACSIHAIRPLSCREFLVTSDPIYCSNPNENDVVTVKMDTRISNAFAATGENDPHFSANWVPLILAPYWQQIHPNQISKKTGPEWVEEFLSQISSNN